MGKGGKHPSERERQVVQPEFQIVLLSCARDERKERGGGGGGGGRADRQTETEAERNRMRGEGL